jgi:hypothetical protein
MGEPAFEPAPVGEVATLPSLPGPIQNERIHQILNESTTKTQT